MRCPGFLRGARAELERSPLARRLARGAFWSLLGWGISRAASLVSAVIVARLLGRDGYGELGMVQSTLGLFGVLAGFGLGATATRYIAEYRKSDPARAGRVAALVMLVSLVVAGVVTLACLAGASPLSSGLLGREGLAPLLVAGAVLLLLSALGGVLAAALAGLEAFRALARVTVVQGLLSPVLAVLLVWRFGVQGAVASMSVSAGVGLALLAWALRAELRVQGIPCGGVRGVWGEARLLWAFSLPALLSGMLVVPVTWLTNVMLVRQGGGYAQLGLFSAANQWRLMVVVLPGLLTAAMLPVLAEQHGANDREAFRETFDVNFRVTLVAALPLAVFVVVFGEGLMALFGRQFEGSAPIAALLMAAMFLNVVNGTVGTAMAGAGRMWAGFAMNLGWALLLTGSTAVLAPRFGGLGLAASYLVAYLAHTAWTMTYVEARVSPAVLRRREPIAHALLVLGAAVALGLAGVRSLAAQAAVWALSLLPLVLAAKTLRDRRAVLAT